MLELYYVHGSMSIVFQFYTMPIGLGLSTSKKYFCQSLLDLHKRKKVEIVAEKILSRRGVAYNLELSPYVLLVSYENGQALEYRFSSEMYKKKFQEGMKENRKKLSISLTNRFGFLIESDLMFDIVLYKQIEKRGFFVKCGEEVYTWPNNIKLNGGQLMKKN